jgi:general secretion pathway protein D
MFFKRQSTFNRSAGYLELFFILLLSLAGPVALVQVQGQNNDAVAPLILRGDSIDSVLALLEKLTGRSVIRPQGLPAPLFNFTSQRPMTVDERVIAIESLLALNGVAVVPQGELFLKVVPSSSITGRTPEFIEGDLAAAAATDGIFTRFFVLQHLTTAEIQPLVQPFLSPGTGQIFLYEKANAMLLTDSLVNLQRVEKVLSEVDRPSNPNVIVKFYDVEHAVASEIVAQVESIITAGYSKYLNANSTIRADDRTNQVIVVTHPSNLAIIEQFIEEIDKDKGLSVFNEAIPLRYGDAVEITGILNEIVSGQAAPNTAGQTRRTQGQAQTRPDGPNAQPAAAPQPTPSVTVRGSARVGGDDYGLQFSEQLTIVADERSNALIVTGTKRDIEQAKQLIEKIDVRLPQVKIDVIIAEVSMNGRDGSGISEFGFDYAGNWDASYITAITSNSVDIGPFGDNPGIFPSSLSMDLVFKIAKTKSNIRLINVPTIITTHNKEAKLIVGESRPLVTGSQSDFSGVGSVRSTVQYRDIGIELTVTPLIGSDGSIQLEIDQTVDNLGGTVDIDGNAQPIITRRQATSSLTVSDGELITLAGFQDASLDKSNSSVGILGQIPVVNLLFRPKSETFRDTELVFFIRPKILKTSEDANKDALERAAKFSDPAMIENALIGNVRIEEEKKEKSKESKANPRGIYK